MKDLLNSLEDQIKPFLFHYFINKEQAKAYNKCCQNATETTLIRQWSKWTFLKTLLAVIKMTLLALIGKQAVLLFILPLFGLETVVNLWLYHTWNPPPPPLLLKGGRTFQKLSPLRGYEFFF